MALLKAVWVLTLLVQLGSGFIAYDCGAPSMNLTTLSLNRIKECNIPIVKPVVVDTKIQLLQTADFSSIKVIQCKIEIRRTIFYCGMHSHISAVTYGNVEYIEEISHEQCLHIHSTKTYTTNRQIFSNLQVNKTNDRPLTLAGKLDSDGSCKGESFSDHYGSWDNVIAYGQILITIQDYQASVNMQNNEVILRSGIRCQYSSSECIDPEGGYTFWNLIQTDSCKFYKYSVLYEGSAQKIKDNSIEKYGREIYSLTTQEVTFALTARGFVSVCGYHLIKTEHPKLFILDRNDGLFFSNNIGILHTNMDIFTYVNSKIVYLERHMRTQIIALYNDVTLKQCELENRILYNSLSVATLSPADFAFYLMKTPGYMAHVAGEAVRIAKCIPVDVRSRKTSECYQELPVSRGNDSLFMLPRTHILLKTGTQIECNAFLSPMFNINNAWYEVTPQLTPALTPQEISAETKKTWSYIEPKTLATGGIYSTEDLEKLRDSMMFPAEKPAVLNTIAREATGQASINQGISMNTLVDGNYIRTKLEEAWGKVYSFFNAVGTFSVTLFGAWVTLRCIKFIIDTLVHGYALHTIYGWSLYLLGAVWDSLTNLLLHLGGKTQRQPSTINPQTTASTKENCNIEIEATAPNNSIDKPTLSTTEEPTDGHLSLYPKVGNTETRTPRFF